MVDETKILKEINESFGSYRAEWLTNKIYKLFEQPYYFIGLQNNRPCVLEGGRGTGKTTVLKGLSYLGRFEILQNSLENLKSDDFIGIYFRINTNHVRSFKGGKLADEIWEKLFSHYFNLLVSYELMKFLNWWNIQQNLNINSENFSFHLICKSLNIPQECLKIKDLLDNLELLIYEFQSELNNIHYSKDLKLTFIGDPIKLITEQILNLTEFNDKIFYFLIDEYENFEDYQQKIINTLIKHSPESYTFKIGVRELGWRVKHTLNENELLYHPADYILINIEQELTKDDRFKDFAKKVFLQRISNVLENEIDIDNFLQSLSIEDEAILLGVKKTELYQQISNVSFEYQQIIKDLHPLYKFLISYWAKTQNSTIEREIHYYKEFKEKYDTRYDNYKYSLLFKLRRGRGTSGIQKYYCGWETFTKMAHGNIRYLMQIIHKALENHILSGKQINEPISPENQTLASQECALKNLKEFEGLYKDGALLSRFLLNMGRIFQLLAKSSSKSAPEKNQFAISDLEDNNEAINLINAAVMHLALIRTPGNKLNKQEDTRSFLYMIHPIYSSYFQFSYRKKRKIEIDSNQFLNLATNKQGAINEILSRQISDIDSDILPLPQQMSLFSNFYDDKG